MTATEPTSDLYFCPRAGEVECATHGGFDQCCDQPALHVPLPHGPGTKQLSRLLDRVARQDYAGQAADDGDPASTPDQALHELYTTAISRWHRDPELPLYTQGADAVLAVRDRRMEQLAAGRATWKAKAEEIERDRDRLATQVDRLTARLGQYADRAIANGERAEAAAATFTRLRALLVADRDQAARNARDARHEHVQLVNEGLTAGLDTALRWLDAVLGRGQEAGDRSACGPRAGNPSAAGHSPGNPSGEGAQ